ncbi:flagellar basal body P-ring protein FlgI [Sulfitobacter sp. M57]|nr:MULTISPECIES: flagellar basal body P-ring protein FlgI [unclassified Sulfitobacter]MDF3414815.1 flagellar basal body P-ring protein FlgI [Sulfitobacter sp. KE5]MDF3422296.1 flagellar basal body P-ring protein FlgI [Sulfitobacter sp. KE43]MDF3459001.1 flagellar basal body P-ring protein FlgI [Sulfitobacter sp. S74]MDF3466800.1 flagellar basal body P-ring protein FlgI [Sulfitobacter sp. M05]MDF3470695.1 flagellar basal body P-ring protein FlgI [Sulfitobacter sp. M28]MDF3474444.1 flagellar ba
MNTFLRAALIGAIAFGPLPVSAEVRIKDIANFEGVRENHLIGYGLVVGLLGSGDKLNSSPFTRESIRGMLERLGVANLKGPELKTKNTAAVMVTAKLPPFARRGSPIDITVSSLGDATSLRGGTLLVTPLTGADGAVYAVAQGAVATSGYRVDGNAASVVDGVPTIAKIENGAIVEKEIDFNLFQLDSIRIALRDPDFTTADRMREAINDRLGPKTAEVLDSGTVEVWVNGKTNVADTIMAVENLTLTPDSVARVVVDEKSGTIVMGADVRIAQVAISQGGLTVRVQENYQVSQPGPVSFGGGTAVITGAPIQIGGSTVVVPETEIDIEEKDGSFTILRGDVSLQELVNGLNAIGVGARQTIAILQAIKAAGALHADLEII